jgi:hypothetical protein
MSSKVLAAMVLAAFALPVAGCGGNDEQQASGPAAAPTATATETATTGADAGTDPDNGADAGEEAGAADKSCSDVGELNGDPKTAPPSDVAFPGDAHVYQSEGPFGRTTRYFAAIDGVPDDLEAKRDDASDLLVENGYKLLSKDQEEGAEAEAHLSGKHKVDVQVITLCEGKLRLRYTIS